VTEPVDSPLERAERDAARIRREAERDAEDIRRNAIAAADRLLGRIQALEFPLGQLVVSLRDEVKQVARELYREIPADIDNPELPPDTQREAPEPPPSGIKEAEPPPDDLQDDTEPASPPVDSPSHEAETKRSGRLVWQRSKQPDDIFIAVEGSCAICHRSFKAGSEKALASSGWKVSGDVGLCPDCQTDRD